MTAPPRATGRPSRDTWKALADQGLYSATSFATTLLIARNTSVEDLGWFSAGISLLITTVGFMSSFVAIPLLLTIQGSSPRSRAGHVSDGLGAAVAMAGAAAGALVLAIPLLAGWSHHPAILASWLLVLAAAVIPMVVREYARQMAFAQPGLPGLGLMDLTYSTLALGGLALLARGGRLGAGRGLAVVGGAALASVLVWILATRPAVRWASVVAAPRFLKSHLRMSRWLCGASVLYACSISAIPWLLGLLATSASVGTFAAYATIAGVLNPLLLVAGNLTAPRTARAAIADPKRGVRRVALMASAALGAGLCVVALGIALGENTLMPMLFGTAFQPVPYLLRLLLASAVCEGLGIGAFWGLHSIGQSRLAFWARAAAVAISLPLGAWGILRFGVLGAVWLMLSLRGLNAVFNWMVFLTVSRSADRVPRVALLVNLVAPYRVAFYDEIARYVDLDVLYSGHEDNRIGWEDAHRGLTRARARRVWGWVLKRRDSRYLHISPGYFFDLVRSRPDAIVTSEMGWRTLVALGYGRLTGTPVWVMAEVSLHSERHCGRLRLLVRKLIAAVTRHWIAVGECTAEYLESLRVPASRVTTIQNTVDERPFRGGRHVPVAAHRKPVAVFVGQLVPRKGVGLLLEAVANLAGRGTAVELLIAGQGPERPGLEARVSELKLAGVSFLGQRTTDQVAELFQRADFLVFPTLEDVWGLVVNEALWSDLPVLASRYAGSAKELLPAENIFDPLDDDSFVAALERASVGGLGPADQTPLWSTAKAARRVAETVLAAL